MKPTRALGLGAEDGLEVEKEVVEGVEGEEVVVVEADINIENAVELRVSALTIEDVVVRVEAPVVVVVVLVEADVVVVVLVEAAVVVVVLVDAAVVVVVLVDAAEGPSKSLLSPSVELGDTGRLNT